MLLCLSLLSACEDSAPPEGYRVFAEPLAEREVCIGFRKGDSLRDIVDRALQVLKANGEAGEISKKWFGEDVTTIVPNSAALGGVETGERVFILGIGDGYAPTSYLNSSGEMAGFDLDMAAAVCELLGWELEIRLIEWGEDGSGLKTQLQSGNVDCIWSSGMPISEELLSGVECSAPYLLSRQVFVVTAASSYTKLRNLKGGVVAVRAGSFAQLTLDSSEDVRDSFDNVAALPSDRAAFAELDKGAVDAVLIDSIAAGWYISGN